MDDGHFLAGNAYCLTLRHQLFQVPDQFEVHIAVVIGNYQYVQEAYFQ